MSEPTIDSEQYPQVPKRKETSFAGDVLKLVSGATIAQALGILAAPIYTRLYAPEAFGVAALFASMVAVIGVFATMRYELAIMLPKSDEEAANLVAVSLGFAILVSGLAALFIRLFRNPLVRLLNAPEAAPYLWLAPLAVFVAGIFITFSYWNSRTKHFGRLSIARVTNSVVTVSSTIGAGYAGFATGGSMIGAKLGGQAVAAGMLGGQIWREDRHLFRKAIRWQDMLAEIKRYRKFPLYSIWATLLNTASWQLPVFLLSTFFSTAVVGFYALGFRIIQLPMNMIGRAIGQVFFQRAAEAHVKGTLSSLVESIFRQLVMFGLFPMLLLTFVSSDLFSVVFGPKWAEAGVYAQILAPWAFVWFVSSPLSALTGVLEKQEFSLFINILIFLTRLVSIVVGGVLGNVRLALVLFSFSGILVYGYLNLWLMGATGISWKNVFRILLPYLGMFAPVAGILVILKIWNASPWIMLGVSFVFSVAYLFYLLRTVPQLGAAIRKLSPGARMAK